MIPPRARRRGGYPAEATQPRAPASEDRRRRDDQPAEAGHHLRRRLAPGLLGRSDRQHPGRPRRGAGPSGPAAGAVPPGTVSVPTARRDPAGTTTRTGPRSLRTTNRQAGSLLRSRRARTGAGVGSIGEALTSASSMRTTGTGSSSRTRTTVPASGAGSWRRGRRGPRRDVLGALVGPVLAGPVGQVGDLLRRHPDGAGGRPNGHGAGRGPVEPDGQPHPVALESGSGRPRSRPAGPGSRVARVVQGREAVAALARVATSQAARRGASRELVTPSCWSTTLVPVRADGADHARGDLPRRQSPTSRASRSSRGPAPARGPPAPGARVVDRAVRRPRQVGQGDAGVEQGSAGGHHRVAYLPGRLGRQVSVLPTCGCRWRTRHGRPGAPARGARPPAADHEERRGHVEPGQQPDQPAGSPTPAGRRRR